MSIYYRIGATLLFLFLCRILPAQEDISPFQLLYQLPAEATLQLDIDLSAIRKGRFSREWHNGNLSVVTGDSVLRRFDVQVQVRGKMRRQTCSYPQGKRIKFRAFSLDIDRIERICFVFC